ncbi:hypothetical protein LRS10_06640 [Phenylobacterium sp. J426]|uniref:hypothetical protein n=1 Tax=Phenylobacterium sp. J426 TaxID=2898439 RepID=UPI002150E4C5|nr:hypothetical protein [Phenylobacterium sp. J426]MCR5873881.1 hypothetical protein [Phenylobacterium sp. J426]
MRLFSLSDSVDLLRSGDSLGCRPCADHILREALRFLLANRIVPNREDQVMPDALELQLEAYHRLRPKLIEENQSGWALVAREALVRVFAEFEEAARYADQYFSNEQVLIRHTSEQRGMAPFIASHG